MCKEIWTLPSFLPQWKQCWPMFLGLLLLGGCQYDAFVEQKPVSFNGNFLFYNAPAAQRIPGTSTEYVSYVNRWGAVMVTELIVKNNRTRIITEEIVHEYTNSINYDRGYADDHAAPALLFDTSENRLLVATAYHGSDLFLYEKKLGLNESFRLVQHIPGRYTYPRFIEYRGKTYLFLRNQSPGKLLGHLVVRSSLDNFTAEQVVIPSDEGHVIYASVPALFHDGVMIQYSTHSYETEDLEGWNLAHYDPESGKVVRSADFSSFIPMTCVSNRPTGIAVSGGKVLMATACFEPGYKTKKNSERFFSRENYIRILQVDLNTLDANDTKLLHDAVAVAPYYHTSVAVHEDGTWLYFDGKDIRSNRLVPAACRTPPPLVCECIQT